MSSSISNTQGLLHFRITSQQPFAIGTLKVKEIVPFSKLFSLPKSSPNVLGTMSIRGKTIAVIDVAAAIGFRALQPEDYAKASIIVTDVSRNMVGLMVRKIEKITACRWSEIETPPANLGSNAFVNGITYIDDQLVQLLDVEKLLLGIFPESEEQFNVSISLAEQATLARQSILLVDDSVLARKQLSSVLDRLEIGYDIVDNGRAAFELMQEKEKEEKPINILVSDIEMPGLDGYELCFEVRSAPAIAKAFIILHTSLSSEISVDRAKQVGANMALTKFDGQELINAMLQGANEQTV
ncbi:chemotaxis signal transduction protein CheV [Alginatibacterium sediminis]|uniref:Chemotaxis signal transduction protein CheV n=1 Tax=Alginatibacterium sediminis TaxID=2164068 RepID=A0A420EN71_9ALTE|nr:chemotaxis protein [Alginatibacterium sediminis]RKF22167.1 chemotaxis signal transduction protein CheV [Alginatibacterium sediminis]